MWAGLGVCGSCGCSGGFGCGGELEVEGFEVGVFAGDFCGVEVVLGEEAADGAGGVGSDLGWGAEDVGVVLVGGDVRGVEGGEGFFEVVDFDDDFLGAGGVENVFQSPLADAVAFLHDGNMIADLFDLVEEVAREKDGFAVFLE